MVAPTAEELVLCLEPCFIPTDIKPSNYRNGEAIRCKSYIGHCECMGGRRCGGGGVCVGSIGVCDFGLVCDGGFCGGGGPAVSYEPPTTTTRSTTTSRLIRYPTVSKDEGPTVVLTTPPATDDIFGFTVLNIFVVVGFTCVLGAVVACICHLLSNVSEPKSRKSKEDGKNEKTHIETITVRAFQEPPPMPTVSTVVVASQRGWSNKVQPVGSEDYPVDTARATGSKFSTSLSDEHPSVFEGQKVQVWSQSHNTMTDAVVIEVSNGHLVERGEIVPSGAIKVSSSVGEKWVLPDQLGKQLRSIGSNARSNHGPRGAAQQPQPDRFAVTSAPEPGMLPHIDGVAQYEWGRPPTQTKVEALRSHSKSRNERLAIAGLGAHTSLRPSMR